MEVPLYTYVNFLFPDWERAVDSHGRIYYIDHLSRATTWHRPKKGGEVFISICFEKKVAVICHVLSDPEKNPTFQAS